MPTSEDAMIRNNSDMGNRDIRDAVLNETLATIEERRNQIVNRSTIMLAASSAVMVLAGQSVFALKDAESSQGGLSIAICLLIASVAVGAFSVLFSLGLIKVISREAHKGVKQRKNTKNIFYFGWLLKQDENDYCEFLAGLDEDDFAKFRVRQAISLSGNLRYRYRLLRASYISFAVSLFCYVASMFSYYFGG